MRVAEQNGWFIKDNQGCNNSQNSNATFWGANQIFGLDNFVTDWEIMEEMRKNWPSSVGEFKSPLNWNDFWNEEIKSFFDPFGKLL
jgi:hypothetical protein